MFFGESAGGLLTARVDGCELPLACFMCCGDPGIGYPAGAYDAEVDGHSAGGKQCTQTIWITFARVGNKSTFPVQDKANNEQSRKAEAFSPSHLLTVLGQETRAIKLCEEHGRSGVARLGSPNRQSGARQSVEEVGERN